jgi:hypothetical protein
MGLGAGWGPGHGAGRGLGAGSWGWARAGGWGPGHGAGRGLGLGAGGLACRMRYRFHGRNRALRRSRLLATRERTLRSRRLNDFQRTGRTGLRVHTTDSQGGNEGTCADCRSLHALERRRYCQLPPYRKGVTRRNPVASSQRKAPPVLGSRGDRQGLAPVRSHDSRDDGIHEGATAQGTPRETNAEPRARSQPRTRSQPQPQARSPPHDPARSPPAPAPSPIAAP